MLDKEFPSINIYGEEIKQGFQEPCFFVKILSSSQEKEFNRRYKKSISFDIHYFSDKENVNEDCLNMADKLYEILEYEEVDNNLYRSSNMAHEIIDGILHFSVQFSYFVIKEVDAVPKINKLKREVCLFNGRKRN